MSNQIQYQDIREQIISIGKRQMPWKGLFKSFSFSAESSNEKHTLG